MNTRHQLKQAVRVKQGDTVRVRLGKDRGKTAKILAVLPKQQRVLVDGVNMVHKHVRPKRVGQKGQRVQVAAPVHISNVQLVCPSCKQATRVGIVRDQEKRSRVCKRCQARFD